MERISFTASSASYPHIFSSKNRKVSTFQELRLEIKEFKMARVFFTVLVVSVAMAAVIALPFPQENNGAPIAMNCEQYKQNCNMTNQIQQQQNNNPMNNSTNNIPGGQNVNTDMCNQQQMELACGQFANFNQLNNTGNIIQAPSMQPPSMQPPSIQPPSMQTPNMSFPGFDMPQVPNQG